MAEFVFKEMLRQKGLENEYLIESRATSTEEIGNHVYPPVKKLLEDHGINCSKKRARRLKSDEYWNWDYIIAFDNENVREIARICGPDIGHKVHLLKSYIGESGEIDDPWYTRNFQKCYDETYAGCVELLKIISK